jgi:hypothetical protein
MPDPSIAIGSPAPGATVPLTFPVSGTYTPAGGGPPVTVVLKNAAGVVVATATGVVAANGRWSGRITAPGPLAGATVEASVPGADATAGNITVVAP